MSIPITVTVNVSTDEKILADRVAVQLQERIEWMELTLGGETSVTNHTVGGVTVGGGTKAKTGKTGKKG